MHKSCLNCDKRGVCRYKIDAKLFNNMGVIKTTYYAIFEKEIFKLIAEYCLFYSEDK